MKPEIRFHNFIFDSGRGFPTPTITTSINKERTSSYQYLGSTQTINLDGYIINNSTQILLDKALELKSGIIVPEPSMFLFTLGGKSIISGSGYVTDLSFDTEKNRGVDVLTYSIKIDFASTVTGQTTINRNDRIYRVSNVEDNISISVSDNIYYINNYYYPLYNIQRTISAKGNIHNSMSGSLVEAINWINDRRQNFPFTGIIPISIFPLFDHKRNLELNELDGTINITDQFVSKTIQPENPWIETFTVDTNISDDLTDEINLKGSIVGLLPVTGILATENPINIDIAKSGHKLLFASNALTNTNSKYTYALSGYSYITGNNLLISRANNYYTGLLSNIDIGYIYPNALPKPPLNTGSPINFVETFDPFKGEITYNIGYNNRPQTYISGAISELITITDNIPISRTNSIPVLGRRLGPVVYFFVDSSGLGNKTVTYEGVFLSPTGIRNAIVNNQILITIDNLVDSYKPSSPYSGYITKNDQKININENRIIRSKTWSYTKRIE